MSPSVPLIQTELPKWLNLETSDLPLLDSAICVLLLLLLLLLLHALV